MSKHVIFFVAGVGDDEKGWSKGLRAQLEELFDSYPLPAGGQPFAEKFETAEIFYNDFFDDWRERVAADARSALDKLGGEGLPSGAVEKLFELGIAAGGGGFLRTHAMDALQYRFLRLVSEPVRSAFEAQVLSRLLDTEFGTPARWSVIAHSLGTSIVHDALHEMFAPGPGAKDGQLYQPYAVAMLSNVSQLLHNERVLGAGVDAYSSFVRPNREPALGACRYFLSSGNRFDPIAVAGNFKPPESWLPETAKVQRRFRSLDFDAIPKSGNVHGFREYLAHPGVHVPLIRILTGDQDWISDEQENAAHEKYRAANALPGANDLKRRAIEELDRRARGADWAELVVVWKEVLENFAS